MKKSTETNGTAEKNLKGSDVCPFCNNTGWEEVSKDGQGVFRECRCGIRQKQIMQGRLSFAEIPETFRGMRLNDFSLDAYKTADGRKAASSACKAIKYWLNNLESMEARGMGLYLYSNTKGSGKTRMAASIANELMTEKKMQVKFATSVRIINEIKRSWNKETRVTESNLIDFLSTTQILVLDDFGTEQVKDWIGERFYGIINYRYVEKKITIFTSNESISNLNYDDRITNRIKERTFQIPFPNESVRENIAKENMGELLRGMKGR